MSSFSTDYVSCVGQKNKSPLVSNPPRRNRTLRRHPHKVLDRWRAEQVIGSRQVGSCERHQIAI